MVKVFAEKFDVSPWDRTHQVRLFTDASHVVGYVVCNKVIVGREYVPRKCSCSEGRLYREQFSIAVRRFMSWSDFITLVCHFFLAIETYSLIDFMILRKC